MLAVLVIAVAALWGLVSTADVRSRFRAHILPCSNPRRSVAGGGEALWLDVDGARVEAWFLPARGESPAPTAHLRTWQRRTHRHPDAIRGRRFAPRALHVLLVEYPGYGRSGGNPSEDSRHRRPGSPRTTGRRHDPRVDATRIVGYGRSLGGGAIAQLAARRPLAALVLESTFIEPHRHGARVSRSGLAGR